MQRQTRQFCSFLIYGRILERKQNIHYILFNFTFFLRKERKHLIFRLQLTCLMISLVTICYLIRMSPKNHSIFLRVVVVQDQDIISLNILEAREILSAILLRHILTLFKSLKWFLLVFLKSPLTFNCSYLLRRIKGMSCYPQSLKKRNPESISGLF